MNRILYLCLIISLLASCTPSKKVVTVTTDITKKSIVPFKLVDDYPELVSKPSPEQIELPEHLQTVLVRNYRLQQVVSYNREIPTFYPVTTPSQRIRNDVKGDGYFGASRGRRIHNGLDIIITPGSAVYTPIEGIVFRKAFPYGTQGKNKTWEGLLIVGINDYAGYEVKIFYVRPFLLGDHVLPGEIIGVAQDISRRYSPRMIDHVHVEVRRNGILLDPAKLFNLIE